MIGRRRKRGSNLERLFTVAETTSDIASDVGSQVGAVRISEFVEEGSVTLGARVSPPVSSNLTSILKKAKQDRAVKRFAVGSSPEGSPLKKFAARAPECSFWEKSPEKTEKPVRFESSAFSEALDQQASCSKRRSSRQKRGGGASYEAYFKF